MIRFLRSQMGPILIGTMLTEIIMASILPSWGVPVIPWLPRLLFSVFVGLLVGYLFKSHALRIEEYQSMRNRYETRISQLVADYRRSMQSFIIASDYFYIMSKESGPVFAKHLQQLDEQGISVVKSAESIAKLSRERLEHSDGWRLILERVFLSHKLSLEENSFSLSLRHYLDILLDTIKIGCAIAEEMNCRFVVHSYTNALPKDWFKERNPIAGSDLANYGDTLAIKIARMREQAFTYRRFILCSDRPGNLVLPSRSNAIDGWLSCGAEDKKIYLDSLHTSRADAILIDLNDDIEFKDNYAEFIYFGFEKSGTIDWEWCYRCAYTDNNLNVSAQFLKLNEHGDEPVIDIPNDQMRKRSGEIAAPTRYEVALSEFPLRLEEFSDSTRIEDILPLADRWDLAAEIWHGEDERELILKFLKKQISAGATILDCSCGTGFHCFALKDAGYNIVASDQDEGNLKILQEKQQRLNIHFDTKQADWRELSSRINCTFDCVLCLGSSITYFDSWDERISDIDQDCSALKDVVQNFKNLLSPEKGGKVIIGISRHYTETQTGITISFRPKHINNVMHFMKWKLVFDWIKGKKEWYCKIRNENNHDFSFRLVSHLFDVGYLIEVCKECFGGENVAHYDPDSSYYDTFVICTVKPLVNSP